MYFHGALFAKFLEKHPEYQVYNNLFPNYANETQLGTWTYEEHVQDYVENFDLDYISYDLYPYYENPGFELWIENLRIVADAGRSNNKDYWVVTQANNQRENVFTSIFACAKNLQTWVKFKVSDAEAIVTEHSAEGSFVLQPDSEGYYRITIENAAYSFVIVE